MESMRLFMLLLGCRPQGRLTEQHDIFFGIANSVKELIPAIKASWPEAKGIIHVDAWREVKQSGNFSVCVKEKKTDTKEEEYKLFFINLGGYKAGEFDEFHYKTLIVAKDKNEAIREAKQTTFYKHVGFKGATSHIDDKYGVDVDDMYEIKEILSQELKNNYRLEIKKQEGLPDLIHLGYFKLDKL